MTEVLHVSVDETRCVSSGTCAATCPEVFEMLDDGKLRVREPVLSVHRDKVELATEMCPTAAIEVRP